MRGSAYGSHAAASLAWDTKPTTALEGDGNEHTNHHDRINHNGAGAGKLGLASRKGHVGCLFGQLAAHACDTGTRSNGRDLGGGNP